MLCGMLMSAVLAEPIFDGRSLDGFEFIGDRDVWRVENGAIIGQADGLAEQTWLYWPGPAANFHLTLEFRINAGNSGINYRSRPGGSLGMIGYQADLDAAHDWTGALYDVDGRGLMTPRGHRRRFGFQDNRQDLGVLGDADALVADAAPGSWHTCEIIADGPMLTHRINGRTMSQTWDEDPQHADQNGGIAFQLHPGEQMDVAFRAIDLTPLPATDPGDALKVPEGFTATRVIEAGPDDGSWVSMAFEPAGTLLVSPQHGRIRRIDLDAGTIEPLEIDIGASQGMVHAHDAMYVMVSRDPPDGGLHRLRDVDGDGRYDEHEHLAVWGNGSEHGPHAVVLGPEGDLWIVQGNHTPLPPRISEDSPFRGWAEDLLLERQWDANGHAVGITAPGGVVLRTDRDATQFHIVAGGQRNACDLAFNPHGSCFTWDSDMEWDMGMPWYRPPRIVHVLPGADNGWRSGTGKWPDDALDALPAVTDTPPGSPTALVHAGDGAFGVDYEGDLLAADWSYGRIWRIVLRGDGPSWRASVEPFAQGRPFNVSAMRFGPDGALYVVTGGRGTSSALWRIEADEPQVIEPLIGLGPNMVHRNHLLSGRASLDEAWAALGSGNRVMSTAARVALRGHDDAKLTERALATRDPARMADAMLALAQRETCPNRDEMLRNLTAAAAHADDADVRLDVLRAMAVLMARHGDPDQAECQRIADALTPLLDQADVRVRRQAAQMLVHLRQPMATWLLTAMEDDGGEDAIHWALLARLHRGPWSEDQELHYLRWLRRHDGIVGGRSARGFLQAFERRFLEAIDDDRRSALLASLDTDTAHHASPSPRALVEHWTLDVLNVAMANARAQGDGATLFDEARCIECHRVHGRGGSSGPDLTWIGGRMSESDLLRAIIEPNHDVSDQYLATWVETDEGLFTGRLIDMDEQRVVLDMDPYDGVDARSIDRSDIVSMEPSDVSTMPHGLVNTLSPGEIRALLTWLRQP